MTSAPLPDAPTNWVDRHAPEGLKPWLKLGRFDRPTGIWLLMLPGWMGLSLAAAMLASAPAAAQSAPAASQSEQAPPPARERGQTE